MREAREAARLTQAKLADGIVAASYVSLIESGHRNPSQELLEQFAERLGVRVTELGSRVDEERAKFSVNAAQVAIAIGAFEEARKLISDAQQWSSPDSATAYAAQALACETRLRDPTAIGSVTEALRVLDTGPVDAARFRSRLLIALLRSLHDAGDLSLATDIGQRWLSCVASESWPEDAIIELLCMTATCHAQRGDTGVASELIRRAVDLAQSLGSPQSLVQTHWESAWIQHERGERELASANIKAALKFSALAEMTDMLPRVQLAVVALTADLPGSDLGRMSQLADDA